MDSKKVGEQNNTRNMNPQMNGGVPTSKQQPPAMPRIAVGQQHINGAPSHNSIQLTQQQQQQQQQQQGNQQPQQHQAAQPSNTHMHDVQNQSTTVCASAPPPSDDDPRSLLTAVADYEPSIPDAVTRYFLSKAGCSLADPELAKVVSLAAQLFVGELAAEVHDSVEIRAHSSGKATSSAVASAKKEAEESQGTKMLASDLAAILRRRGLNVQKPEFQMP